MEAEPGRVGATAVGVVATRLAELAFAFALAEARDARPGSDIALVVALAIDIALADAGAMLAVTDGHAALSVDERAIEIRLARGTLRALKADLAQQTE